MTHLRRCSIFSIIMVSLSVGPLTSVANAQAWLELFGQPTITGAIRSIAQDSSKLYVSGPLLSVADRRARGLATYDTLTGIWSPVALDLGDGFSRMAWYDNGSERALYGAGLPDRPLVKIEHSQLVDLNIRGSISGLRSVSLRGKTVLVASGSFHSDDQVFGLALWNGQRWRFLAELTPNTLQLSIVKRDDKEVIYALESGGNTVVEFDGFELVYRKIPLLIDVAAISSLTDRLAVCDRNGGILSVFDGLTWSTQIIVTNNVVGCRNLTSRRLEDRDQLLIRGISGNWDTYEADSGVITALELPTGNDRFTRPIAASGNTALVTLSARQASRQLAIWESDEWVQPEQSFKTNRFKAQLRSAYSLNGMTFVFGKFTNTAGTLQSAVGIFSDEGVDNLNPVPEQSSTAVMDESGIVYAWTPEGLWINRGAAPVMIEVADAATGGALTLSDTGQLFVGTCGRQLLRLQGDALEIAAELPEDLEILCSVPMVTIPETSSAAGLYFMAAKPPFTFESGRRISVWRFDGTELMDVSAPQWAGLVAGPPYLPQVSAITMDGKVLPALAFGNTVTWFDDQQWNALPSIPDALLAGGDVSGPVATAKVGNEACLFTTLRTQLLKYCHNVWSTSDMLSFSFVNTINLIFQRGIQTLIASEYQKRPVLLVGGTFDAAGNSTQSRTAVLDVDVIHNDNFEF
ncbi:MAG: hypothetical protein AB8B96_13020 [Lysobacterales bacterium]